MKWGHSFLPPCKSHGNWASNSRIQYLHGISPGPAPGQVALTLSLVSPCSALACSSLWTSLFSFHHHCTSRATPQTCQQESNRLARGSTVHLLWNFLACQALGLYNNKVEKSICFFFFFLHPMPKQAEFKVCSAGKNKKSLGTEKHKGSIPERVCPPTVLFLQMSPLKAE